MRAVAGGLIAGALVALLILAVGGTAAAWIGIALCLAGIGIGALDYVTKDSQL